MALTAAYHADSDADDEYERSVLASPTLHTDDDTSPTDSDPPSTEPTPTFGKSDVGRFSPGGSILEWSTRQCADYITSLGLPQYCEIFVENEIVGEALVALRHEELKEMAITSVGHRLTILKGVYDIKVEHEVPLEADDYVPPSADASLHNQNASSEDVFRIVQSLKIRDDRFSQMEQDLQRITEEYRKLRDELLPIFRMAKDKSQPLPFPAAASPDLQHHEEMMSPLVSQAPADKTGSTLSRKFSTKRLFLGSAPKSSSPTHATQSIPENQALNGNSALDPSAAALAASSHLTASMNGEYSKSISPSRANLPSPTSPNVYSSTQSQKLAQRPYRDAPIPSTVRSTFQSRADENLPHSVYSTTSTITSAERERSGPTPTPGSTSRTSRKAPRETPREISISSKGLNQSSAPSSGRNDVEIFKSFRVGMEEPTVRVLPEALKKYNISADPKDYSLFIVCGDEEKELEPDDKPLRLFKDDIRDGKKPMFMLRKNNLRSQTQGRQGADVNGSSIRTQTGFPPGGVL